MNSNDLKLYFNKYYKCCDSLKIANKYIKPLYFILMVDLSPIICYIIYYLIFARHNIYLDAMLTAIFICFIFLLLIMSIMISYIDIVSKKALHVIHGFAILNKDMSLVFQVFIYMCFEFKFIFI